MSWKYAPLTTFLPCLPTRWPRPLFCYIEYSPCSVISNISLFSVILNIFLWTFYINWGRSWLSLHTAVYKSSATNFVYFINLRDTLICGFPLIVRMFFILVNDKQLSKYILRSSDLSAREKPGSTSPKHTKICMKNWWKSVWKH